MSNVFSALVYIGNACTEVLKGEGLRQEFFYDPDTLVMYMQTRYKLTGQAPMLVMLNADGTPKLYSPNEE